MRPESTARHTAKAVNKNEQDETGMVAGQKIPYAERVFSYLKMLSGATLLIIILYSAVLYTS